MKQTCINFSLNIISSKYVDEFIYSITNAQKLEHFLDKEFLLLFRSYILNYNLTFEAKVLPTRVEMPLGYAKALFAHKFPYSSFLSRPFTCKAFNLDKDELHVRSRRGTAILH